MTSRWPTIRTASTTALEAAGSRVLFKIDYHGSSLCGRSADPADPMLTMRVLTIMLAVEY